MNVWSCFVSGYKTPFCMCVHDRNVFFVMYHNFVRSRAPYHGILRMKLKITLRVMMHTICINFHLKNVYFYSFIVDSFIHLKKSYCDILGHFEDIISNILRKRNCYSLLMIANIYSYFYVMI